MIGRDLAEELMPCRNIARSRVTIEGLSDKILILWSAFRGYPGAEIAEFSRHFRSAEAHLARYQHDCHSRPSQHTSLCLDVMAALLKRPLKLALVQLATGTISSSTHPSGAS